MKTTVEALEFLYRFIGSIPDGLIVFDIEGFVSMLNQKAITFLEKDGSVSDYIEQPITNLIHEGALHDQINHCLHKGRTDFSIQNYQIGESYFELQGKKISDGMMLTMHDITKIVEATNKSTGLLIKGQELERQRLAKEIHDGIGPFLSTLKLNIDLVERKTKEKETASQLVDISKQLSEISTEVRQISHDLMPSSLLDYGLIAGIQNHIGKLKNTTKIEIELDTDLSPTDNGLSKAQELNIFRIIQESVQNAIKHAECKIIKIKLLADNETLSLGVSDDGVGLKKSADNGIGIKNIKTRIKSLGGQLEIKSKKGIGLSILANIPLN